MGKNTMQRAYEYIFNSILTGKIPLGSPINEVEVANELGISRSPVRESLKKLEAEGIVNYIPRRGVSVIQINKSDLEEIFELRLVLELTALKRAQRCLTKDYLAHLEKTFLALDIDSSETKFYEADKKLHHIIVRSCGNKRLECFYERLEAQIDIVRRISAMHPKHFENSKIYHLEIVRAMKNEDYLKAARILEEHINDVKQHTINAYSFGVSKVI